jgi:glycosyltransferase involved in cell wall biosynthesis
MEHGVDFEHFSQAASDGAELPDDIATISGPVVGYFGEVDYKKVDQALIRHAALARPSWSFVFIGNVSTDISSLADLPNVHFLGARPYRVLPVYAKAFAVCTVPWDSKDEMIQHASPIKIREYLATGTPVVSTDFPEAHRFGASISIACDRDEFVLQIEAALGEKEGLRQQRMDAVKGESWESRVEALSELVRDVQAA